MRIKKMKKWDDLLEETMTPEAIIRSNARAEAMIAQIHNETATKQEKRRINRVRYVDHGKHTAVPL